MSFCFLFLLFSSLSSLECFMLLRGGFFDVPQSVIFHHFFCLIASKDLSARLICVRVGNLNFSVFWKTAEALSELANFRILQCNKGIFACMPLSNIICAYLLIDNSTIKSIKPQIFTSRFPQFFRYKFSAIHAIHFSQFMHKLNSLSYMMMIFLKFTLITANFN